MKEMDRRDRRNFKQILTAEQPAEPYQEVFVPKHRKAHEEGD